MTQSQTWGRSLVSPIRIEGRGIHSNAFSSVVLMPVTSATGLRFIHPASSTVIPVHISSVTSTAYATTLAQGEIKVQTVEHLLSALVGLSIFHLDIVLESPERVQELPILDGSSNEWVTPILNAGIADLNFRQKTLTVKDEIRITRGQRFIHYTPASGLTIDYTVRFDSGIGTQHKTWCVTPESYVAEIAPARTFCHESEYETMQRLGLAQGGSLNNAVVFSSDGPLNELRYSDEPVRHKILDLLGDLALLGSPVEGKITACEAGHQLHTQLCRIMLEQAVESTNSK